MNTFFRAAPVRKRKRCNGHQPPPSLRARLCQTRLCSIIALALFTLLGGASFALAEGKDKLEPKPITVPFELLKTQHMVVAVKINGKGPYRLIFDTGAPINLVNNKVAKETGIIPKDFKRPPFALFGSIGQFKIDHLEVGDLKAANLKTMVMDHPTVAAIANVLGPIEGIVGFSFFAKYRMTLDYQAKTMTFVPTDYQPVDMLESLMKMLTGARGKDAKKVLAPGGLLGLKVAKDTDDMEPGANVKEVFAGSPAAKAGFKEGDRLLTLDDRWTDSVADCFQAASRLLPGTSYQAVVRRDGKEVTLQVELKPGL